MTLTPELVGAGLLGLAVGYKLFSPFEVRECPTCEETPTVKGGGEYSYCPVCNTEVEKSQTTRASQILSDINDYRSNADEEGDSDEDAGDSE